MRWAFQPTIGANNQPRANCGAFKKRLYSRLEAYTTSVVIAFGCGAGLACTDNVEPLVRSNRERTLRN